MKLIKRTAAMFMAVAMVLAMGVISLSADSYNITISEPQKKADGTTDAVYTAYKIFTLVKGETADPNNTYDYTLDGTSAAYTLLVDAYENDTLPNGVTLEPTTKKDGSSNLIYNASVTFDNATAFANWLKTNKSSLSASSLTSTTSGDPAQAVITVSDLGYYFIDNDGNTQVPMLTTVNDQINIKDKASVPMIEKTVDDNSVEVGQVVTYTIDGKVPDTTGFDKYLYTVTDTMDEGLTFNSTVANMKVVFKAAGDEGKDLVIMGSVEDDEVAYTGSVLPSFQIADNGFALEFDMTRFQTYKDKEIVITYNAKVNEDAAAVVTSNKAILKYSNDPQNTNHQEQAPPTEVAVYTSKIVVDKYKDGEKDTKLSGAKFVLYKVNDSNKVQYYKWDGTNKVVSWTVAQDDITPVPSGATEVTTNASGAAEFLGLEDGTYFLHETAAPSGYNALNEDIKIEVEHMIDPATQKEVGVNVISEVPNKNGTLLPNTGSIGTIGLTAIGVIVVAAGMFMFSPKKKVD